MWYICVLEDYSWGFYLRHGKLNTTNNNARDQAHTELKLQPHGPILVQWEKLSMMKTSGCVFTLGHLSGQVAKRLSASHFSHYQSRTHHSWSTLKSLISFTSATPNAPSGTVITHCAEYKEPLGKLVHVAILFTVQAALFLCGQLVKTYSSYLLRCETRCFNKFK